ncbi:MAG: hypothetical protein JSS27_08700 [Planctomycetes bacterium]|nr:hypothetical protein [Planctomycetota bacterium]
MLSNVVDTLGPVYLLGYSVECILKSLILNSVPNAKQEKLERSFRGAQGHDFTWLKRLYVRVSGRPIPASILADFTGVEEWSVELRYNTRQLKPNEFRDFSRAARRIVTWADQRM